MPQAPGWHASGRALAAVADGPGAGNKFVRVLIMMGINVRLVGVRRVGVKA